MTAGGGKNYIQDIIYKAIILFLALYDTFLYRKIDFSCCAALFLLTSSITGETSHHLVATTNNAIVKRDFPFYDQIATVVSNTNKNIYNIF